MKIRPLPPIDLARAAAADPDRRERILRAHKGGHPAWSYDPVRRREDDLLNSQARMLPVLDDTPWEVVTERLWHDCKGDQAAFNSNLEVAKLTYQYVRKNVVRATLEPFPAFDLGLGGLSVSYWARSILIVDERPCIAFFDHRRTRGLFGDSRAFAYAVMHHHIRAQYADLTSASLAIIRFPQVTKSRRQIDVCVRNDIEYTLDELHKRITDTYNLWNAICEERVEKGRSGGSGG